MTPWLFPLLAFLLGSIPFGLLISKFKGIDIRKHGSGNIGATNVLRILGKKYGFLCLFLDALKGYVPVFMTTQILSSGSFNDQLIPVFTALAAVLGHNYSPWIGFKGGKGIATSAGVLLALMPAAVVILLLIFIVALIISRYVAVASMTAAMALPILTHLGARFHGRWQDGTWNKPLFVFSLLIAVLALWKHRSNVQRLLAGTESRFVWGAKKKKECDL